MPQYTKINSKMIEATVNHGEQIYARRGSMLAYKGDVYFEPTITAGAGMGGFVGRMVAGEQVPLMMCQGQGTVLYGHAGLQTTIVELQGDQLTVEADKLLCYDGTLQAGTQFLGQQGLKGIVRGQIAGQGLFTTTITGYGSAVLLSHGPAFELNAFPGNIVAVDPQSYVGHRGHIDIQLDMNVGWRDAVGRGSGEAFQLKMNGQGVVYVQASEMAF